MGLVRPVLIKRINNEILGLNGHLGIDIRPVPENAGFPIEISVVLRNTPSKIYRDETANDHIFIIVVSEEYPYERPRAKWMTPIFHPNIMMPEDGGFVCVKTLDNWSFWSSLLSFVKGVEQLISDPNPMNPYGTESCMEAARWYIDNKPKLEARIRYCGSDA